MYKPPFSITNKMLSRCISITEKAGRLSSYHDLNRMPVLRRNNRIKSIHSSLGIENNTLSIDQTRDIISGKAVLGPKKEIQEVKNAYRAYEMIDDFDGFSETDLLRAHALMTESIEPESGRYRNHAEGVFDGDRVIFIAPPENMVPKLMNDLFQWLKRDKETPIIIKSCVFHYEFVFIHPFGDGNGRMARLWQNVLLAKWNPVFKYIPIESQILKYQSEYYKAIEECHKNGNSDFFIEFMLKMIDETLDEIEISVRKEVRNISDQVNRLLNVMEPDIPMSANELMQRLGIKSKETLRHSYIDPAMENGLVFMTLPDKPNSKNQKYYRI